MGSIFLMRGEPLYPYEVVSWLKANFEYLHGVHRPNGVGGGSGSERHLIDRAYDIT